MMTRRSLNQGTEVVYECPWCDHIDSAKIVEKTTAVCENCRYPFEVYEDGRVEASALMVAHGEVSHGPPRGVCMCCLREVRTIYTDKYGNYDEHAAMDRVIRER